MNDVWSTWAQSEAHSASAKIGPVLEGRFHAAFLQCAHAVLPISLARIVELIVFQGVSGKAAVFQTGIIVSSPHAKYLQDPQVLADRILTSLGEVAERLKAVVC